MSEANDLPKIDQTGIPSRICLSCGGEWFQIYAMFDDEYEIAAYFIDNAECATCGAAVTVPTPIDHPNFEVELDDDL